jgi:serine/threonine protein kinase
MRHHSYKPLRTIGRGSFGRVELVESDADGKCYVMKV